MISRRGWITGALSSAAALALPPKRPVLAYVGSYSSPQGPEGSHGNGKGIYLFEMNPESGALAQREVLPNGANPSWLALDGTRTHLYSANETADGSVSAYEVERASGRIKLLNTVSSQGAGPAHLSVHPSGKHVLVANYHSGTVAVLPILPGGELGAATDLKHDQGPVGPANAASAPSGSFAISGHDAVHAHMIQADPSGRFVLAADLGLDRILIWKFDAARGKLTPNDPPWVALPPGDGPRHFIFHPNGRWVYSLQEEASTLVKFAYDGGRGRLTARQTVSTLPKGFAGTNFTSELRISNDARFVYAANRLHDTIAWFAIAADGNLTLRGEEWTRGDYPRSFTIDPSGGFLYTCNQRGDAIACFRGDRGTGALRFTGQYTAVGTPAVIVFLD
jgi:6-phosphogluconolactonase (cycloisomerase 2 family)